MKYILGVVCIYIIASSALGHVINEEDINQDEIAKQFWVGLHYNDTDFLPQNSTLLDLFDQNVFGHERIEQCFKLAGPDSALYNDEFYAAIQCLAIYFSDLQTQYSEEIQYNAIFSNILTRILQVIGNQQIFQKICDDTEYSYYNPLNKFNHARNVYYDQGAVFGGKRFIGMIDFSIGFL